MRIKLTVIKGPNKGRVFRFTGRDRFIVGRSKLAHFRLPHKDRYFSRIHFLVEVNPPYCRLMDMGSRNGTFVNGQEVHAADLKHGDEIKAGRTVLRVSVQEVKPRPAAATGRDALRPAPTLVSALEQQPAPPATPLSPEEIAATYTPPMTIPGPAQPVPLTPAEVAATYGAPDAPAAESATGRSGSYGTLKPLKAARAPVPAPPPEGRRCRACEEPVAGGGEPQADGLFPPELAPVCAACQEQIRRQAQPIDDYVIVRKVGEGGMGVVYLALRKRDGTPLALKTITPAVTAEPRDLKRFLREAAILRDLDHPHIVAFREMGCVEGRPYFAMDFVRGTDAARLVKGHGPLPIGRAVGLVCQLLEALEYAHAKDYVHRDIKPANLLVTDEGGREVVKVADFGLARIYQASKLSGVTLYGEKGGTYAYMAPEQITNFRDAKPPVDRYAAGATLYNLLTNRLIYDLPRPVEQQMLMVLHDDPIPIQERRADVPDELAALIHRALARDPRDRFTDVTVMRKALEPFRDA